MTDIPPQPPPQSPPPIELVYQTPLPYGNAPLLVKLAAIFNFISAGLDLLQAIAGVGTAIFMQYILTQIPPAKPGAPPLVLPSPTMFYALYGTPGILSLLVLGFKIYAGVKLLRRSRHAWGWGLAAAIIGCAEIWALSPCCIGLLHIGIGVYSLVILCLADVRLYLQRGVAV
jgi:hypothetical protein